MHKQEDQDNIKREHLKILSYISILLKPLRQNSNPSKAPIRADIDSSSWSNGLVVKALDSQSRGPVFKTAGCLQGRLSLSSSRGR